MTKSESNMYLQRARESLEGKNLIEFIANISIAKYLAQEDQPLLEEIIFEEVSGFYLLNQFENFLSAVETSLQSISSKEKKVKLLTMQGISLTRAGRYSEALSVFESLSKGEDIGIRMIALSKQAWVYLVQYSNESKLNYLIEAEKICNETLNLFAEENHALQLEILDTLGTVYWYRGEFEKALEIFLSILKIPGAEENPIYLYNVGATYASLGKGELALKYAKEADFLATKQKDNFALGLTYLVYGRVAEELHNDYLQAKDSYLVAYDFFVEGNCYRDAFKVYKKINMLDKKLNEETVSVLIKNFEESYDCRVLSFSKIQ